MRETVEELRNNSKLFLDHSKDISASTTDSLQGINAILATVEELSAGYSEQARNTELSAEKLQRLAQKIDVSWIKLI
ncbi:hypothetical protein [Clostridium thermarum]|uniref:hypothetical protein n=1 Tax=Clostridium thermarum TaxID=1716543 RepID=UPI0013D1E034|nr:hypothetical protein [Clostridium thermarum]